MLHQLEAKDSRKELSRQVSSGIRWLTSTTLITQVFSWIFTIWTARILKPSDYGLLALNEVLYPYFILLSTFRIEQWAVQRQNWDRGIERQIFPIIILFGLLSAALGFAGAYGIAAFYSDPEALLPFQVCSVMYFFRALQVIPEVRIRRKLAMKELSQANMVIGIGRGALQLSLAVAGWSYWSLVIGNVVGELVRTVWFWILTRTEETDGNTTENLRTLVKEALAFGAHASGAYIFWVLYSTADNAIVGRFFGKEVLGIYSMAFYLIDLPVSKISGVVSPLMITYFARLRHSPKRLERAFLRATLVLLSIVCPLLLGLSGVASDFCNAVLGERWVKLAEILPILAVVGILRALPNFTSPAITAYGRSKYLFYAAVIPGVIIPICFITSTLFSVSYFSEPPQLQGIIFTWLIIYPIVGVIVPLRFIRISTLRFMKVLTPIIVTGFTMFLIVRAVSSLLPPGLFRLSVCSIIGALVYFWILFTFFRKTALTLLAMMRRLRITV